MYRLLKSLSPTEKVEQKICMTLQNMKYWERCHAELEKCTNSETITYINVWWREGGKNSIAYYITGPN